MSRFLETLSWLACLMIAGTQASGRLSTWLAEVPENAIPAPRSAQ